MLIQNYKMSADVRATKAQVQKLPAILNTLFISSKFQQFQRVEVLNYSLVIEQPVLSSEKKK